MNGETIDKATLAAIVGTFLTLMAFCGGLLYRLGRLDNRVDNLGCQIEQQAQQYGHLEQRFDQLSQRFDQLINLVISENAQTREENRRNHQELLQALAHHSHDPDTGFAIFRIPPGSQNPAS